MNAAPDNEGDLDLLDYGDSGVLVNLPTTGDDPCAIGRSLMSSLLRDRPRGLVDVVSSFVTVYVAFDPTLTTHARIGEVIRRLARTTEETRPVQQFILPVIYGERFGEDLEDVARELSLSVEQFTESHSKTSWMIRCLGSPACAPLMDEASYHQSVRRMREPRTRVPGGSVAVSGRQCVMYPVDSPGGWRLIGQTPVQLFDLFGDPMTVYRPGDSIRFVPIEPSAWARWNGPLADLAGDLIEELGHRD